MSKGFLSCESFDVVCETLAHNLESVVDSIEYFYVKDTVTVGLNMLTLHKLIRSMFLGDLMEWRMYEDEPHAMYIELSNSERRTKTVNCIKTLDLEEVEITIPHVEFDRIVSMPSSDFSKHVREISSVSNFITIKGTKTTLELLAKGDMSSSHVVIEPTASGLNWKHSEDGPDIEGKFVVKYIEKFCKCTIDNSVEIFLRQDFPLVLLYSLKIGTLRFCIAPATREEK